MNVNTIFKLLPAVVLSVITMENCQNMDKNENTKEEKNAIEIIMARKSVRSYTSRPVEKEKVDIMLKAAMAAPYVDVLQIPAFLCRQTDLLIAAARTGKVVNIKKGQFLSPEAMQFAAQKVVDMGNDRVMLTERGTTFGYQDLVVDFRAIPIMQRTGFPVIIDATHSLQQPNQSAGVTGGMPDMIETIARAGIAVGADGLFIETHPEPQKAKSDGANMLRLDLLEGLLVRLLAIRHAINTFTDTEEHK